MRTKPHIRLFIIFQSFLCTGYGLILKNLEDSNADKFLVAGIGTVVISEGYLLIRRVYRNLSRRESL